MALRNQNALTILLLCVVWYSISATNNVVGKMVLNQFPYPMTVTMVQLVSISVYSEPLLKYYVKGHAEVPTSIFRKIVIPLAIGKFLASVTAHISIWRVPVSYSHTVKATMPLFTVVLSRVLFGEKQTKSVYLSLVPIILGVVVASLTEFHFDMLGLISALVSTAGFSLQHIFSKRVLKRTGIHQFQLLATLARLSLLMFLPFWLIVDARRLVSAHVEVLDPTAVMLLLFVDGFLNFCQNIIAFSILKIVSPLTYAVANASKRIAVIGVSILLLRNPVSIYNLLGMITAVGGVLLYNRAKHLSQRKTELPIVVKGTNDSNYNYLPGISSV